MQLNLQTFNEIVEQEAAAIQSATTVVNNFSVGSFTRSLLETVASVALWLQAMCVNVLSSTRLATSSGIDVDTFVNDFGLTRLPAVATTGNATFSRYSSVGTALLIPGVQVATLDLTESYTVTTDTTNAAWNSAHGGYLIANGVSSLTVPVVAVDAGSVGNILANTIGVIQTACPFDTVTNNSDFTSGVDSETDSALRNRFAIYVNTRSLSTVEAVQYAATSVQAGVTAFVAENVSSSGAYQPGNFVVTIDDGSGSPPASLIASVYAAVKLVRGASISFAVQPPTVISAVVSMTLAVSSGYVASSVEAAVQTAIVNYISALPVGTSLPYSILANLAYNSSPGITNVTGITLNGGTADLGGGATQVVRVGTVTVT